ncbi:hypothetical protein GW17_00042816, partial [Ensete ventricosum]
SPPCAEERGPSGSSRNDFGSASSSSGAITRADAKALQALEAMKSFHDFDFVVTFESLALIWKRYSIPDEYILHAPKSGQHPYHPCPGAFSISIDALEARLRFPLHPIIGECLGWWRISPSQMAPNSWHYLITFLGECRGSGIVPTRDLFLSCFRLCKDQCGYYLTSWAVDTMEEPSASRRKPKSVRELCSASVGVDGRDYHAIRMCSLSEHNKVDLLHKQVQRLKEGGDSDVVAAIKAQALEAQSLAEHLRVELDEASRHRELVEVELEGAQEELASLLKQLVDLWGELAELHRQLNDSESQLWSARTQVREMEIELLELTRSKDAIRVDLLKRVVEDYTKSPGFEIGLIQMGRVSLEYRY